MLNPEANYTEAGRKGAQARDIVIADHAAGHDRRRVIMLAAA